MPGGKYRVQGRRERARKEQDETEMLAFKDEVERKFKPVFEEHSEAGGIPLRVLRQNLQDQGMIADIPNDKVEYLIQKADRDQDGHLDYDEFMTLITSKTTPLLTPENLSSFQKMVRGAVLSVVPGSANTKRGHHVVDEYITYYNCRPPPLFMIIISIVEVAVFIWYAIELRGTPNAVTATSGVALYSPFIFNPSRRYEAWRFVTYMLLHNGYMHLIFNLIFQLLLGIPLEMVHKWWRVGTVYILGVIAGTMCHTVFDTHTLLCGASGGCYALIGAHFAIVVMNWKEMTMNWLDGPVRFILSAPVRLFVWTAMASIDTGIAIYSRYTSETSTNVGYAAHFGGALAGLLIGIPVLRNIDEKPWERIVWWVSLVAYLCCVIFSVFWNIFYPHFPETDWRSCCPSPQY